MKKYCVWLELAKEMKELGISNSYKFYWLKQACHNKPILIPNELKFRDEDTIEYEYPAYTVGELGEMLPDSAYSFTFINKRQWRFVCSRMKYKDLIIEDTEANARAKMLIYLKKEGII